MRYVYQTYTSAYLFDTRVTVLGHIGWSVKIVVGFSFKSQNFSDKSLTLIGGQKVKIGDLIPTSPLLQLEAGRNFETIIASTSGLKPFSSTS